MKAALILLLQLVFLFPMDAFCQIVTICQNRIPPTDRNFTFFAGNRNTGQLALVGNKTYFSLDPYNGKSSTQYQVRKSIFWSAARATRSV